MIAIVVVGVAVGVAVMDAEALGLGSTIGFGVGVSVGIGREVGDGLDGDGLGVCGINDGTGVFMGTMAVGFEFGTTGLIVVEGALIASMLANGVADDVGKDASGIFELIALIICARVDRGVI